MATQTEIAQRVVESILAQKLAPGERLGEQALADLFGVSRTLVREALTLFYDMREVPGVKKKPSTSELLDWLKLLLNEDISGETLREADPRKLIPPLHGALLKNEQDVHLFERLAFMTRRKER
ncbi:MAG: GntR family transcriptional regulator [Hyphomicrobiaceae bacterium]|nr:MAG: GntR family transcriptional regulator [Hyphomicrobiaceae bacterium]